MKPKLSLFLSLLLILSSLSQSVLALTFNQIVQSQQGRVLGAATIGFDSSSQGTSSIAASSLSWSHTVGSNLFNSILVVGVSYYGGTSASVSSISYGSQNLTKLTRSNDGVHSVATEMWYLTSPAAGTNTVSITMTASVGTGNAIVAGGLSFSGVHQSSPFNAFSSSVVTGTHAAHSTSVTATDTNTWLVDVVMAGGSTGNPNSPQTQAWGTYNAGFGGASYQGPVSSAGSVSSSWNLASSSSASSQIVAALNTSSSSAPQPLDTQSPSVPAAVSAIAQSSSAISLSWAASTDNIGVAGYRIYRGGSQIATVTSGTTYQDTGLTANTAYSYTIQAYDSAGNSSAQSSQASATTQAASIGSGTMVVLVGQTISPTFPTTDGTRYTSGGPQHGPLSVLTVGQSSTALNFSTILGQGATSAPGTEVRDAWIDPSGNIYIGGTTSDRTFPTTAGTFQRNYAGGTDDGFLCKYSQTGTKLWCTYIGTSLSEIEEKVYSIAGYDNNGNLTICGRMDGPVSSMGGVTPTNIGPMNPAVSHPFIAKVKPDGSALVWYTLYGGSGTNGLGDTGRGRCVLDSSGNVYAAGLTASQDFPVTAGAYKTVNPATKDVSHYAGFVGKLSADGSRFIWLTYVGGSGFSSGPSGDGPTGGIALDSSNNVIFSGYAHSNDIGTTAGAYQTTNPATSLRGSSCFIGKLRNDGAVMLAQTFFGGSQKSGTPVYSECMASNVDAADNIIVQGITPYVNHPTTAGSYQPTFRGGSYDGFVARFSSDLSNLLQSTFIGGTGNELGDSSARIELDSSGNIWSSMLSTSSNFPVTPNAYQSTLASGGTENWVFFQLSPSLNQLLYGSYLGGNGHDYNRSIRIVQTSSTPPPQPAPVISSFTASPTSITSGGSATLSWNVTGATSLSLNQGIGTVTGTSRSVNPTVTTTYVLTATNSSGSVTSSINVTVGFAADTTSPTASVTSPASGSTVSGTITVSATASDPSMAGQTVSGLKSLSLLIDGSVFATSSSGSLSKTLNSAVLSNGSHSLTATALDNAGNSFTTSATLITVSNVSAAKYPRLVKLSTLEGISVIPANTPITAYILSLSSGALIRTASNLTPDAQGNYTVSFQSSDPQMVDIRVQVSGYLSRKITNIDTTQNTASPLTVSQLLAGDFNSDNAINTLDYSQLNQKWNQTAALGTLDINRDGLVNSLDFAIFKNNFNKVGE